jgi:hypothetical protein
MIVEPNAKPSGSTSVACWLVALVNASVLNFTSGTVAGGKLEGEDDRNWLPLLPEPQAPVKNKAATTAAKKAPRTVSRK